MWKSHKITQLINDTFRKTFQGGKVVLTHGIRALSKTEVAEIMLKVSKFNDFTVANDPYEEHDYGSFECNGKENHLEKLTITTRITNIVQKTQQTSQKQNRVLTIMLCRRILIIKAHRSALYGVSYGLLLANKYGTS